MLRFWLGGKERAAGVLREAKALANTRTASMRTLSDAQLLAQEPVREEKVVLGRMKAKCVSRRESAADGSTRFLVQIWGDGFIMGSWLLACDGSVLSNGERASLGEDELRSLNL